MSGAQFGLKALDLKSQVWFQSQIARYEVQLPLYYNYLETSQ